MWRSVFRVWSFGTNLLTVIFGCQRKSLRPIFFSRTFLNQCARFEFLLIFLVATRCSKNPDFARGARSVNCGRINMTTGMSLSFLLYRCLSIYLFLLILLCRYIKKQQTNKKQAKNRKQPKKKKKRRRRRRRGKRGNKERQGTEITSSGSRSIL